LPSAAKLTPTNEFYHQQTDNSPATNIPQFSKEKNFTPAQASSESEQQHGAQRLKNRWDQIKQPTTPSAQNYDARDNYSNIQDEPSAEKSGGNKFVIGLLIVFLLAGILGIVLVVALSQNNRELITKKPSTQTPQTATTTATGEAGKKIDTSILSVVSTITIYADDLNNIPNSIFPYLQKSLGDNGYYRILIKNKKNDSIVGLRQFFNIYKINAPSLFYTSIDDNFTLFIYANNNQNRLGFITEIKKYDSLRTALNSWEKTAVADTNDLFKLINRKNQDNSDSLKFNDTNASSGIKYRSMSFSPTSDNFAIAWIAYKEKYFIFTTSNDSMAKIFSQLPK
jgi:hypothetical protein